MAPTRRARFWDGSENSPSAESANGPQSGLFWRIRDISRPSGDPGSNHGDSEPKKTPQVANITTSPMATQESQVKPQEGQPPSQTTDSTNPSTDGRVSKSDMLWAKVAEALPDDNGVNGPHLAITSTVNWHIEEPDFYSTAQRNLSTTTAVYNWMIKSEKQIITNILEVFNTKGLEGVGNMKRCLQDLKDYLGISAKSAQALIIHTLSAQEEGQYAFKRRSTVRSVLRLWTNCTDITMIESLMDKCEKGVAIVMATDMSKQPGTGNKWAVNLLKGEDSDVHWLGLFMAVLFQLAYRKVDEHKAQDLHAEWLCPAEYDRAAMRHKYKLRPGEDLTEKIIKIQEGMALVNNQARLENVKKYFLEEHHLVQNIVNALSQDLRDILKRYSESPAVCPDGMDLDKISYESLWVYLQMAEAQRQRSQSASKQLLQSYDKQRLNPTRGIQRLKSS